MKRLRLLLCDDEPQILSWLQSVLEPDYDVIGTARDGQILIATAQVLQPDLILTEIDLPLMNGLAAVQELRAVLPACRVIFHTSRSEPDAIMAAFAAGAAGYLIKGTPSLRESIHTLVARVRDGGEEPIIHPSAHHMF